MNILLTNDDGFDSYGIRLLKEKLVKYGRVVIVAPDSPMSAQSVSLTIGHLLHLKEMEKDIFSCDGTPADCVSMGLSLLNIEFDLVVSGCNNGLNISYDTMYSGTIGAGQQALMFDKPAIAFSSPWNDFNVVEERFDEVFEYIVRHKLYSKDYLLNVNFPAHEFKGIALGTLYYRDDYQYMEKQEELARANENERRRLLNGAREQAVMLQKKYERDLITESAKEEATRLAAENQKVINEEKKKDEVIANQIVRENVNQVNNKNQNREITWIDSRYATLNSFSKALRIHPSQNENMRKRIERIYGNRNEFNYSPKIKVA